jgi:hypothetical protein
MCDAGERLGIDLTVVKIPSSELLYLYEKPLVLIRPDHIVAWRGKRVDDAENILAAVTGRAPAPVKIMAN